MSYPETRRKETALFERWDFGAASVSESLLDDSTIRAGHFIIFHYFVSWHRCREVRLLGPKFSKIFTC